MAFPKHLLNQHEELILDLQPHWIFLAPSALLLAAAVVAGLLVQFAWHSHATAHTVVASIFGILVLVALARFGWRYLHWARTNFVLTSDRIVTRRGVFTKAGVEIPLERVNTVIFHQTFLERLVGAGDIGIDSAGARGEESFSDIRKPSIVQKEIYVQMEANEARRQGLGRVAPGADATTPQPSSIPQQIDQLSELHQRGVLSDAEFAQKKAELLDRM